MKKLLLAAMAATLLVGGGMFAFTFTTATASIGVNAPASDFASVAAGNVTAPSVFGKYTGTWPTSTVFTITPAAGYPADLVVSVYMANAGALIRYYQFANMSLKFVDSNNQTADEQGAMQLLNLTNSEVEFTWANGTGTPPYRVILDGGSFRLHPWKTLTGGSVQPQLWCEISQR